MVSTLLEVARWHSRRTTPSSACSPPWIRRAFERCCLAWLREAADLVGAGHIAIDGKTLRGSASATLGPLHLVSAWATQANLTLGQVAVDEQVQRDHGHSPAAGTCWTCRGRW